MPQVTQFLVPGKKTMYLENHASKPKKCMQDPHEIHVSLRPVVAKTQVSQISLSQFKTVYLQGPQSFRPHILRPCFTYFDFRNIYPIAILTWR